MVQLRSTDPFDSPKIDPCFLQHEEDAQVLMEGKHKLRLIDFIYYDRFADYDCLILNTLSLSQIHLCYIMLLLIQKGFNNHIRLLLNMP